MVTTAYFAFSAEHRANVRAELERDAVGKVGVADVARALGAKWRALSDDEKKEWATRASEVSKRAAEGNPGGKGDATTGGVAVKRARTDATTAVSELPVSRVKKLVARDEDVSRLSRGAALALAAAVEHFVKLVVVGSQAMMRGAGRKTLRFEDFEAHVRRMENLGFIRDQMQAVREAITASAPVSRNNNNAADAQIDIGENNANATTGATAPASKNPDDGDAHIKKAMRPLTLTSFFGAAQEPDADAERNGTTTATADAATTHRPDVGDERVREEGAETEDEDELEADDGDDDVEKDRARVDDEDEDQDDIVADVHVDDEHDIDADDDDDDDDDDAHRGLDDDTL